MYIYLYLLVLDTELNGLRFLFYPICGYSLILIIEYISFFQGWSLSDVMFVTKHNMANAVATVSKQLENVSETLAVSCEHSRQYR